MRRTRISTANPTATFIAGSITSVDHSWTSPISSPPARAPYALPMPPTTTAAKMLRMSENPQVRVHDARGQRVEDSGEPGEPALAAQVIRTIRSVSIPVVSASWMLSARARVCRPSDVNATRRRRGDHDEPDYGHDQLGPPDPQLTEVHAGRDVGAGSPVLRAGDESDHVSQEEREPER